MKGKTMFQTITINIELNDEQEAAMPTSGPAELKAINAHSAIIDHTIDDDLDYIQANLCALGYTVTIER